MWRVGQWLLGATCSDVTVGRRDAQVTINDKSVSRKHAVLSARQGVLYVCDQSSLGTFIDGLRCVRNEPTPVAEGAALRFGANTTGVATVTVTRVDNAVLDGGVCLW